MRTLAGPQVVDLRQQFPEGVAGVENVVHQQHVAAANVGREQIEIQHQRAGPRAVAAIAAGLHQFQPQRQIDPPDQIRQEHDAADQHADDRQRAALVMLAKFLGKPVDALAKLFLADQGFHSPTRCGKKGIVERFSRLAESMDGEMTEPK